jgi:ABC-type uncharacterized transport system ATPase subunit
VTAALELSAIAKRFGPVHALRGADFAVSPGEVHALLGENGAGKSTLLHIAGGLLHPDAGSVRVGGREVTLRSPRAARQAGIGLVHQHFTSIATLSVAENVALAAGWPMGRPKRLQLRVRDLSVRTGLVIDPTARAGDLPVAARQRLEVLKALAAEATILLLDEPTGALAPADADDVLRRIRAFADAGGAAVLVTHKLDEALRAADCVTVLRAGRVVLTAPAGTQSPETLAAAMIGAPTPAGPSPQGSSPGGRPTLVRCRNVHVPREDRRGAPVEIGSFEVAAGELVGVAAIEGSGQREVLRAIAGLHKASHGVLEVAEPVAFVPEDRNNDALIGELSLAENVALGFGAGAPWVRPGRLDWDAVRRRTRELIAAHGVVAAGVTAAASSLSGGNQQKLVVARALARNPRVLVAENPTRGLDWHAARAIWSELARTAAAGAAILVWSSDLDEILAESTRIVVVARGELRIPADGADRNAVGALMVGARSGGGEVA